MSWNAGWLDITQSAGLAGFRGTQGSEAKNYIVESIGGGCGFIDYNGDGRLDVLLVRGTTLDRQSRGGDPVIALYENRGDRKFVAKKNSLGQLCTAVWRELRMNWPHRTQREKIAEGKTYHE